MIKLLLLVLLFFVGYSFIQTLFPSRSKGPKSSDNAKPEGEQMVLDPQCGTYIPLSESVKANIQGQQHYFCSRKCRSQFKKKH
ncbi:PP0621 family protein [Geopsychrobacter electrodiphilus]|uniref:PP0621 family protein n=1 Tax=Geopsychrobacter electrodiphilus TaxID=225196 RepID=UPI000366BEFB|nr:PP0621 family protein [Geopsychrobacter electrodiphilus]